MADGRYFDDGTVTGGRDSINIKALGGFYASEIMVVNDHATATLGIAAQGVNDALLLPGEDIVLIGRYRSIAMVDATNTIPYRIFAFEENSNGSCGRTDLSARSTTGTITPGSVNEAALADVVLFPATAIGRGRLADDIFTTAEFIAGAGGKFATGCFDAVAVANVFAADSIDNANFLVAVQDDSLAASVAGRAIMENGYFDAAAVLNKFGANTHDLDTQVGNWLADSLTAAWFERVANAGCISATVAGRAAMAADYFTTAMMSAGGVFLAGGISEAAMLHMFGANSWSNENLVVLMEDLTAEALGAIRTANLDGADPLLTWLAADTVNDVAMAHMFATGALSAVNAADIIADDAFTAAMVSTAGAGGKFVANAITNAGVIHLFIDDAFTAVEVSTAGAGGKFAADCITAAGALHLFLAGAMDNAAVVNAFADDVWTAVEVSTPGAGGKFAAGCITAAGADHLIADNALGEDLLTPDEVDGRALRIAGILDETGVVDMQALVANRPTIPVEYFITIPNAAAATVTYGNFPLGMFITEVRIFKNGVASGGDTVVVQTDVDGGTGLVDLFTAVDIGAAGDDVTNARVGWNQVQGVLLANADLTVTTVGAGGDRGFDMLIRGLRFPNA